MTETMVQITADSSRDDLVTCIGHINDQAKRELRWDNLGRPNARWAALHANLDLLVAAILNAPEGHA
jgi:hypothetical protein